MGCVYVKSGVAFTVIAPGGFRILSAFDQCAAKLDLDLVVTSGCDGKHSGPDDPHHSGNAFDMRSHDLTGDQKESVLSDVSKTLGDRFYGFLEAPDTDNEHFHFQVKKGTTYP